MALDLIIDVAEIDDLAIRVAAEEPQAHAAREIIRSSRVHGIWGVALVAIATFGLMGRMFEPQPEECCDSRPGIAGAPQPEIASSGWPPNGHAAFRYPVGDETRMAVRLGRIPGLDDSIAWLAVGIRIDGPPGEVVVKLISGPTVFEELTVPHARGDGPRASRSQQLELAFRFPSNAAPGELWISARAFVGGRVVAVESFPVDPTWSADGPGRFVLDDVVGPAHRPVLIYSLLRPLRS